MSKSMIGVRIPGLDHSLSANGEWIETENYHGLTRYADYAKRINSKGKPKGVCSQDSGQLPIREGLAS